MVFPLCSGSPPGRLCPSPRSVPGAGPRLRRSPAGSTPAPGRGTRCTSPGHIPGFAPRRDCSVCSAPRPPAPTPPLALRTVSLPSIPAMPPVVTATAFMVTTMLPMPPNSTLMLFSSLSSDHKGPVVCLRARLSPVVPQLHRHGQLFLQPPGIAGPQPFQLRLSSLSAMARRVSPPQALLCQKTQPDRLLPQPVQVSPPHLRLPAAGPSVPPARGPLGPDSTAAVPTCPLPGSLWTTPALGWAEPPQRTTQRRRWGLPAVQCSVCPHRFSPSHGCTAPGHGCHGRRWSTHTGRPRS